MDVFLSTVLDTCPVSESDESFFDVEARARLGATIEAWRQSVGVKKFQLALEAGMSRTTLDAILQGKRVASLEKISSLAAALHTTAGTLIDGRHPPSRGGRPGYSMLPATASPEGETEPLARQVSSEAAMGIDALLTEVREIRARVEVLERERAAGQRRAS